MIEARNFYGKEATEGEPRSIHEEKGGKHELCGFHSQTIAACTCLIRSTLHSVPAGSIQIQ